MSPGETLGSESDLRLYVQLLVRQHGRAAAALEELVRICQGAFPTLVREVATCVARQEPGLLIPDALRQQSAVVGPLAAATSVLPLPHPLDFEWRFSPQGCALLAGWLDDYVHPGDDVALLGTPGFAEQFPSFGSRGRPTLFERRPEACQALRTVPSLEVVDGDLQHTCRQHADRFAAAVADPPWYPFFNRIFVRGAARMLQLGGILLLSVPGLATRPGLPAERADLIQTALSVGLVLESVSPGAVAYESPPFEIAALGAAGLFGFDTQWRRGDLLHFRRMPVDLDGELSLIEDEVRPAAHWREVTAGRARIRVNITSEPDGAGLLDSVVIGDVLQSVSSRDPRRAHINVWTTTNRVFSTGEPWRLLGALQAVAGSNATSAAGELMSIATRLVDEENQMLQAMGIR